MAENTGRWQIGDIGLTAIVEAESSGIPPQFFLPDVVADGVLQRARQRGFDRRRHALPIAPVGRIEPDRAAWRFRVEAGGVDRP